MKKLSRSELFETFDASVHDRLEAMLAKDDVVGAVVFVNQMLDSSECDKTSAMAYGPGCTYKTLKEASSGHLGDVPSRMQHPVSYYTKEGLAPGDAVYVDWDDPEPVKTDDGSYHGPAEFLRHVRPGDVEDTYLPIPHCVVKIPKGEDHETGLFPTVAVRKIQPDT